MYRDADRIQDALIPAMLESIMLAHIKASPKDITSYKEWLDVVRAVIGESFAGLDQKKRMQLYRRLNRIANKLIRYFVKEKFDTRKMFLAIMEWVRLLLEHDRLVVDGDSRFAELLTELDKTTMSGHGLIENFDKIERSAVNHVLKIHDLAAQEGYF